MSPPSPTASEIFAAWLERQDQGDAQEFEQLVRDHRAQAADLRRVHADWQLAQHALDRVADLSLSKRLQIRFGENVDPEVSLRGGDQRAESFSSEVLQRLSGRSSSFGRYQLKGEIARGGMGAIVKVWDIDLRRHLAMKVILGMPDASSSSATPPVARARVARFLEEAQVTGQLDHPGIVPVHELGLDPEGRVYFTMKLVRGRTLKHIFNLVSEGKEGWTQTKALGVLLKVCEAMAYAHDKGVIHRDLKPGNIMVGNFGEVHVMDWGLARILDKKDAKNIRIREDAPKSSSSLRTEREEHRGETPESPLYTMDGDVVGTPAYMPPEQAAGKVDEVGPHSDVYAMGAMLYHLIAGHMPYVPEDARINNYAIWGLVQQGPPTYLAHLAPTTPAELVAICDKAMARDWKQRYRDMSELAADLSAYLERRVVGAYETGAWAETKKWIERNRPLAASLTAAIVILVAGVIGTTTFAVDAREQATRADAKADEAQRMTIAEANARRDADHNATEARQNETRARAQERLATQKANDVLSLSAIQELKELIERADELWPAFPEKLAAYDRWVADANVLIDGRAADPAHGLEPHPSLKDHQAKLVEIRVRARHSNPDPNSAEPRVWEFDDAQDRWWHAQLSQLVADLKSFTAEKTGLFSEGTSEQHGWGIVRRRNEAATIGERSVSGPDAKRRWDEAITAIAGSPRYAGLRLAPQLGLLPIGADPKSHLWEFAHLQTGEPAQRGADGKLVVTEKMGLVFVLIPGGKFWMGGQKTDKSGHNYDPQARSDESPVHEVELSAYFLSKYEMTQGQWKWLTGRNPSGFLADSKFGGKATTLLNPIEQVSWTECAGLMFRAGLVLPTEAQWEYAARAGTDTPWWTGEDVHSLDGAANLGDSYARAHGAPSSWGYEDWLDDGFTGHAPVGSFRANAFGLHDVIGNVLEWCRDGVDTYLLPTREGDGERLVSGASNRVLRGGSFNSAAANARSSDRSSSTPENRGSNLGVRPARAITP
jgi:formylglycine-generating enzyme required for sulfatase activity/serine/threonine protein kinase